MERDNYTVYMLMRRDMKFYINYTKGDVFDEFKKHSNGEVEQTREYLPVLLVYVQKFDTVEDAETRVKNIKKMNNKRKIILIKTGIKTFIPEVSIADRVQILLHKKHGINGLRYIKESNPQLDYTVCFNPKCPEQCDNSFLILNRSSVEELPEKGIPMKNPNGLVSLIRYYRKSNKELSKINLA